MSEYLCVKVKIKGLLWEEVVFDGLRAIMRILM